MIKEQAKSIALSLLFHVFILVLVIQHQFNIPIQTHKTRKTIKSFLYTPPEPSKPRSENNNINQVESQTNTISPTATTDNRAVEITNSKLIEKPKENLLPVDKSAHQSAAIENSQPEQTTLRKNTSTVNNRPTSAAILARLRERISTSIIEESGQEYIKRRAAEKNKIDKSIASSIKQPELPTSEVDCSSDFNNGIAMISAYLGGTIKCQKPPDIDKFIDARLINRGVKKAKK